MEEIPAQGGAYVLHLRLSNSCWLKIGKLGLFQLLPGDYIYVGSALGPGGVNARLKRHLYGGSKLFWHIDYLRSRARIVDYAFTILEQDEKLSSRLECLWSQALAQLPEAQVLIPGFGASDCQAGCNAHLLYFAETLNLQVLIQKLLPVSDGKSIYFADWMG